MHERKSLLQNIEKVKPNSFSMNENTLAQLLLYGDKNILDQTNTFLLDSVIDYTLSAKWFDNPLIL